MSFLLRLAGALGAALTWLGCGVNGESGALSINEVLVENHRASFDADGNRSPWIELVNAGTEPIDLSAFSLSDDPTAPEKWKLPVVQLLPGDYFLIWCSGKDGFDASASAFHSGCKLDRSGQTLLLSGKARVLVDALVLPPQTEDRSYGRLSEGAGDFVYHLRPTPGSRNTGPVSRSTIAPWPDVDPSGGRYDRSVAVDIAARIPVEDLRVRYTLDGSPPDAESDLLERPIELDAAPLWPGQVLKAAAFSGRERVSQVRTESYFLGGRRYRLPLLAVSMDPESFRTVHYDKAGRGRPGEREGYLEVFDVDGRRRVGIGMGLRLHGQTSRWGIGTTRKSYRIHFRDAYGSGKLRYPLILAANVGGYDRIVLRAGNDDAFRGRDRAIYLRDQLLRELHAQMGALAAHGAWYLLFVNMDPRGVYNVAERIDGDFFRSHLPGEGDAWDVIHDGEVVDGDLTGWHELRRLLRGDLQGEALYEAIDARIDVENYTGYIILNVWAQNHDWPHKNFFAARPRREDAKWIFLSWDAEMSFGLYPESYRADTFKRVLERSGSVMADLFPALMQVPRYRVFFASELDRHLDGTLAPSNVLARLESIERHVGDELRSDLATRFSSEHVEMWWQNYRDVVSFVRNRGDVVRELVRDAPIMREEP